ncbi:hypothetical protein KQX54_001778 [Cotesia glomerata]|uniref:ARID domain-containing protein n=1 Tax=Cotesia glomerata TaxID=32391 RepID=A0AAV7IF52_COTGL|nr:hypothetical protein KQX54_001778 [Cotesia glomerata]
MTIRLLGSACFSHGPYTFYKAVKINNNRVLRLGNFFLTKLWTDTDLVSIGELQLLWVDSRGSNQPLASLRLYFLPENTPDGRRDIHGEDEVLTISEKVVVHVHDLVSWLSPDLEWTWGREVILPPLSTLPSKSPPSILPTANESPVKSEPQCLDTDEGELDKKDLVPQVLTDPGIDFTDVDKSELFDTDSKPPESPGVGEQNTKVVVLSYPRYCRYRALLRRLEGSEPSWLSTSLAAALGGFTALPGTRVLFCRDTFDYPDLETHELLCNHLAPKLKGRPRRKRKKRSTSPGESSNESEASVASTSRSTSSSLSNFPAKSATPPSTSILTHSNLSALSTVQSASSIMLISSRGEMVRRSERKVTGDEKRFMVDVQSFMSLRGTPVLKMPLLGYRQIDLYLFYKQVQKLGGYDTVTSNRLWKSIYDEIGGNTGSTSAATITRRHYERLLLPYERHQRGEETKVRPVSRRSKSISDLPSDSPESPNSPPDLPASPLLTSAPSSVSSQQQSSSSIDIISINSPTNFDGTSTPSDSGTTAATTTTTIITMDCDKKFDNSKSNDVLLPQNKENIPIYVVGINQILEQDNFNQQQQQQQQQEKYQIQQKNLEEQQNFDQQKQEREQQQQQSCEQELQNQQDLENLQQQHQQGLQSEHEKLINDDLKQQKQLSDDLQQQQEQLNFNKQLQEQQNIDEQHSSQQTQQQILEKQQEQQDLYVEENLQQQQQSLLQLQQQSLEKRQQEFQSMEQEQQQSLLQQQQNLEKRRQQEFSENYDLQIQKRNIEHQQNLETLQRKQELQQRTFVSEQQEKQQIFRKNFDQQRPQQIPRVPSPEVIDLESEPETPPPTAPTITTTSSTSTSTNSRDKIIIPTFKKRKLEILREGGLEVTAVDLADRPSVIQAHPNSPLPSSALPSPKDQPEPKQKLISVTVTPDISHILTADKMNNNCNAKKYIAPVPPKVIQSHSIFSGNERVIYGNPKDILSNSKYAASSPDVLDLTKAAQSFSRPNLEIVRVPVVPRPTLFKNSSSNMADNYDKPAVDKLPSKILPMLDSRTIASNNLEITLVNPKGNKIPTNYQSSVRQNGAVVTKVKSSSKYPESPYSRKNHIVNVPNLNNLHYGSSSSATVRQVPRVEKMADSRRISESDLGKYNLKMAYQQSKERERYDRRHSVPNLPSGFIPTTPQFYPPASPGVVQNKFMPGPMIDPIYYSAIYNGLFTPGQVPSPVRPPGHSSVAPSVGGSGNQSYLPPLEFNDYYKNLLTQQQQQQQQQHQQHQRLLMMSQHQAPTSK